MRIKKLEISGFKSFADRARLNFGEGITGVVGPNGCGKSNVVDAIRWVMGEMSAKHLRGRAMQDVIFAGSQNRGAQGMAEVTLTFDNDGDVPANFLNFAEIAVTRRLFRDGSSEYLINKAPVRLRDITDLFLGTGVGTRAYSIIEQGRISFVVSAKPEERRMLIEEVAGITKFKVRKKAAERRMEATEQNLARVCDVVAELERQLVTLRKQARRAERYKEMRAALRDIELHRATLELLRLHVGERLQQAEVIRLAGVISDNQRDVATEESDLETSRLALIEREQALTQMQADSAAHDAAVTALERDMGHWRAQKQQVQQSGDRAAADVLASQERLAQSEQDLAAMHDEAANLGDVAEQDVMALAEAERALEDAAERLAQVDEELEAVRDEAMGRVQALATRRAEAGDLERQHLAAETQLVRGQEELAEIVPDQRDVAARAQELIAQGHEDAASLATGRAQMAQLSEDVPLLREALAQGAEDLQQVRETLGTHRSRLTSLTQIVSRLEGYADGVRALCGTDAAGPQVPGILALVAEVLQVDPAHERAIEAVLGERLQYLLVEDGAAASAAIDYLNAGEGGRGGFIPKNVAAGGATVGPAPIGDGHLGPAMNVVTSTGDAQNLVAYLLGHVHLVDTLQTARAAQAAGHRLTFVTAQGEVVDAGGAMQGGSDTGAGLLATRREIRDLTAQVETLSHAHEQAQAAQAQRTQNLRDSEEALTLAQKDLHEREIEAVNVAKDAERLGAEAARLAKRCAELGADVAQKESEVQRLAERAEAARNAAEAAHEAQEETSWRLSELQERRSAHASQHAGHTQTLTGLRVRMASQQERAAAAEAAKRRLADTIAGLRDSIARAADSSQSTAAATEALEQQIAQGSRDIEDLVTTAKAAQTTLLEARGAYETEQARLLEVEQALRSARRDEHGLADALTQARMVLQRQELERRTLIDAIRDRHDLYLPTVVGRYHDRPEPTAEALAEQTELERGIKAMGPINLTAIAECQEVEERYGFLVSQRDDLQSALEALRTAINRINRTSRERFREAFDAVNTMFQKIYPRLFRGGVARLELTQADDLLEAGVDIIAMPPGKKLQSVGLLSGGEKALTATALVFAIFLIKPSPFCILDEVDAPLDEANVGRFNEMLREISQVSQFIVITHNKQTMLQMDRLYGITMEEPGMSKVVAVDLEDRQTHAA